MNGTEQRERHTAVTALQRRVDDCSLLIEALAGDNVRYRDAAAKDHAADLAHIDRQLRALERRLDTLTAADRDLTLRMDAHRGMNLWRRLQWLVVGCARPQP
jgi:hypothetical protein